LSWLTVIVSASSSKKIGVTRAMARANPKPSDLACVGMLAGLLLLGFAGTLLVGFSPSLQKDAAALAEASISTLNRRLQGATVATVPEQGLPIVQTVMVSPSDPCNVYTTDQFCPKDRCTWYCANTVGQTEYGQCTCQEEGSAGGALNDSLSGSGNSLRGQSSSSGSFKSFDNAGMPFGSSLPVVGGAVNLGTLLMMSLFAFCYYHNAVQPIIETKGTLADRGFPFTGKDDFDNGICGCFDDVWVLIHGCCCPLVRMAHTNAVSGVMNYWATVLLWCCCAAFTGGLGPCCLMVYWRKRLKDIMGLEDHLINDCCITFWCWPLSVIQQGIAVDHASGYEVTGCCTLEWSGFQQ